MVYKRLFHDEDSYEIASKHRRQHNHTAQQSPIMDVTPCNHCSQRPASDGEGESSISKSQVDGRFAKDEVNEDLIRVNTISQIGASGNVSSYLWVNSNHSDEYADTQQAVHLSFFPNYFELDHRVRALVHSDDIYATLLDHPPIKLVSVGPEYQADVPEWAPLRLKNSSDFFEKSEARIVYAESSDSCLMDDDDNRTKLVGTCVIPMPDLESTAFDCYLSEGTGGNCNCLDEGSIRCVRQHVIEARDKLRESLGQEIFQELGFCDMGEEEAAKKWSAEDEQAFHEVVFSNPASLSKKFWDHLSAIFPSRTKKDLVSYYFNAFMLRKRAEQNRFDALNIDSDHDEWQRSELGITEEDDDSVVESLVDQDATVYNQENHEECFPDGIEKENETDTCKDNAYFVNHRYVIGEEYEGDIDDVHEAHMHNFAGHCGPDPVFQSCGEISDSNREDQDIQDDSCTSYEYQSEGWISVVQLI